MNIFDPIFTGSIEFQSPIVGGGITSSLFGTASWATNVVNAGGLSGGQDKYIARWSSTTTVTTSSVYEGANKNIGINATVFDGTNPQALLVSGSTINIISGEAKIDSYAQLNIINKSGTSLASADIVATNDAASETGNFVDLGINSSNYGGTIGGNNEAYLYNTGSNFLIGNTTRGVNANLKFFAGNDATIFPLTVTGSVVLATGSLQGTSSWSTNSRTASFINDLNQNLTITGSVIISGSALAEFIVLGDQQITGSLKITNGIIAQSVTGSFTGSLVGSLTGTASYATRADFINGYDSTVLITTGSQGSTQIISGSLVIQQNITVLGTSSIQNVTASQLNISTNIITVNTQNPSFRFGGLAAVDSGSIPLQSGSILYDSVQDEWIFVHRGASATVTSSHFMMGPETYGDVGNETYIPATKLVKSVGNEHLTGSNVHDDGTTVIINSNTQITGSLVTISSGSRIGLQVSSSATQTYVGINSPDFDATNPQALFVSGSGINVIHAEANLNNYIQLNIVNNSNGAQGSADVVATNNAGTEFGNFVDLGINGSNYGGAIGAGNEAYLYNTGSNFLIGNQTRGVNANLRFFAGNDGTIFPLTVTGSVALVTGSFSGSIANLSQNLTITGSLIVSGSGGAGVFSKGITLADLTAGFDVTGSYFVWRAPYPATVVGLWAIKSGSSNISVNARRSGSATNHAASNLTITANNLWSSAATTQDRNYSIGDSLEIIFSGSNVIESSVQVDFIKR